MAYDLDLVCLLWLTCWAVYHLFHLFKVEVWMRADICEILGKKREFLKSSPACRSKEEEGKKS